MISIVIPAKLRADLLRETLESVKAQTYPDWEAIVVDDGPDDLTASLVESFRAQDSRFLYVSRDPSKAPGAPSCRNQGVMLAKADHVVFLDSDDLLTPTCLQERWQAIQQVKRLDIAFFQCQLFEKRPNDLATVLNIQKPTDPIDRFLEGDFPWMTGSGIWRKGFLRTIGGWDESLIQRQDTELHLRAILENAIYREFPIRNYYWRVGHADRLSEARGEGQQRNWQLILEKWGSLLEKKNKLTKTRVRRMALSFFDVCWLEDVGAARNWLHCVKRLPLRFPTKVVGALALTLLPRRNSLFAFVCRLLFTYKPEPSTTLAQIPYEVWRSQYVSSK